MNFFRWIKNLSVKQTVILAALGVTLYLHFSQGLAITITQGRSNALFLSLIVWITVVASILFIGICILLLIYIIRSLIKMIIKKHKDKKSKKKA